MGVRGEFRQAGREIPGGGWTTRASAGERGKSWWRNWDEEAHGREVARESAVATEWRGNLSLEEVGERVGEVRKWLGWRVRGGRWRGRGGEEFRGGRWVVARRSGGGDS